MISSAGDAALTVADPSTNHTGHLVNGSFFLPQPLGGLGVVKTYAGPVSNDTVAVHVHAADRADRRAAHGRLLQDAHVHADHDEPLR